MCKTKILICAFLILRSALLQASNIQQASTPTGPAGGALTGTYPNPTLTGVTSLGAIAVGSSTTGVLSQVALGSAGALLYAGASGPVWSSTGNLTWDQVNLRLEASNVGSFGGGAVQFGTATQAFNSAVVDNSLIKMTNFTINDSGGQVTLSNAGGGDLVIRSNFGASGGVALRTAGNNTRLYVANSGSVGIGPGNTSVSGTLDIKDNTATTGATRVNIRIGAADSSSTVTLTNTGTTKSAGYQSSDGSAGVTVTTCTSFKNGLCVAGT